MKSIIKDFFATDTYTVDRGYTIHISRAPEFATEAVVEDGDGKQELVDVSHCSWEDFESFLEAILEEYEISSILDDVFTATEAAGLWGLEESTVKRACQQGRFRSCEAKKSGRPWLVTREGMERVYGPKTNK